MNENNWLTIIGMLGTIGAFLYNSISNLRKELYSEINRIEEKSDKRDGEIKELIKDLKQDLKDDMQEIKQDIRRAESFKCAGQKNIVDG